MSYALRHKPERLGLEVDSAGWVDIQQLLLGLQQKGFPEITLDIIHEVIRTNDKRRFSVSTDLTRVRAAQGHSIPVDLGLYPQRPPSELFHGTAERNFQSIKEQGINKGTRHHVHLSPDFLTAKTLGNRKGKSIVLTIATNAMYADGHSFFKSDNGVWLTDFIPPQYISVITGWTGTDNE